jgi:membrane-associated phospholipid phosphatase
MNPQLALWITNFGDTGVILPLAALLILVLWRLESGRSAWTLARALLGCLATMTVLKILFISCGHSLGSQIESPSGHTSLATFFYGSLATLCWARRPGPLGLCAALATFALIVGVGVSRLILSAHNLPEVLLGGSIGALALAGFAVPYLKLPHQDLRLRHIALLLAPLFLLSYGTILPAEQMLRNFIPWLRLDVCTPQIPAPRIRINPPSPAAYPTDWQKPAGRPG